MRGPKAVRVAATLEVVNKARLAGAPAHEHYDALIREAVALEVDLNEALAALERSVTQGGTRAQAQAERSRVNALIARLRKGRA